MRFGFMESEGHAVGFEPRHRTHRKVCHICATRPPFGFCRGRLQPGRFSYEFDFVGQRTIIKSCRPEGRRYKAHSDPTPPEPHRGDIGTAVSHGRMSPLRGSKDYLLGTRSHGWLAGGLRSQMPAYHAYPPSGDAEPRPLPNRLRLSVRVSRVMYLTFL